MTSLTPLWLGLAVILTSESPRSDEPRQSLRVFADLTHTGTFSGPLTPSPRAPNEFGIAVPLPTRSADRLPKKVDAGDHVADRLGRLRLETTTEAGAVVVSIESPSRRWLRLYRKTEGGWRRLTPGGDQSWTVGPPQDGVIELGVGVVMPEAKTAGVHPAWPRSFTVLISTKEQRSAARPSAVPSGALCHSLAA